MIDPKKVTNYNRTTYELQEFLLFCVCVAGKKSTIEAPKLDKFLNALKLKYGNVGPFALIKLAEDNNDLMHMMQEYKIAPYKQRYNSFVDLITKLNWEKLTESTLDQLQSVRGISTKTSRFFLTHSVEKFDEPVLDTHILRFLTDFGYKDVPKSTPQNPKVYERFSKLFRSIARFEGKSVADFDLEVWTKYSYGNA